MVSLFGTNDKLALNSSSWSSPRSSWPRPWASGQAVVAIAAVAFVAFGLVAAWSAVTVQAVDPLRSALSAGIGTAAGVAVLCRAPGG